MVQKMYSLREAAVILGIKVRTAREWVRNGKLAANKYPNCNRWFVAEEEIARIQNAAGE